MTIRFHHGPRLYGNELQLVRLYFERGKTDNKFSAKIIWEPRDLWIGVYWDTSRLGDALSAVRIYICVIPCLPIRLHWKRSWGGKFGGYGGIAPSCSGQS